VTRKDDEDRQLRSVALQNANSILLARQRAEQRSEFYLAEGQRLARIGSWSFNPSGFFDYWSPELFRICGLDPANGAPTLAEYLASVHPQDRECMAGTIESMLRGDSGCDVKQRIVRPDGELRHLRWVGVPRVEAGVFKGVVGTAMDVTEQEHLTRELRRREAYLAEAERLSHTGSFGWRISTGEILWSEETFRIFQYDRTTKPTVALVLQRVHPEDVALVKQTIERAAQDGRDFVSEHRLLMPDGSVKNVHAVAHALRDGSGSIELVGAVIDVTREHQARDALREQAALLDLTRDTVFVRDMYDVITFWNRGAEELYGWTKEDAVGRVSHDLMQTIFPAPLEDITAELIREGRWEGEIIHTRRDGTQVVVASRWSLQRDDQGRPAATLETNNDVTARKQAEAAKERLEVQLRQLQKMEALGTFAGGIAHDFNNILGAILGHGELAQKDVAEGSATRRHLDQVMHAGGRAKALVERILAFSRSGHGKRVPVHVQSVIEETLDMLAASLPAGVRLDKALEAGDAAVVGDATQLHQVVMNLCTNAAHAMEHGGVLRVAADHVEMPERRLLSHGTLSPRPYIRLVVSDTGPGIPPTVLERMFDPFFTTKGIGEGTGLGLSLVHSIVADLGGAIDVATKVGEGTIFTIWLPAVGHAARPVGETARDLPRGNGEVVMIVDDERSLVMLAEETLAQLGYEPTGFDSSVAALQAFSADPRRFDLVLTDETMPELSGTDLAREIRRLRFDIPIVLMSGYSGARLTERAHAAGVTDVLRKPLVSRDIAEPLARALAAGS
jgi:PAS domain S-box-containing protein